MTRSTMDERLMQAAKDQGRCDGRWGAPVRPGDWEGVHRAAYIAEHAEGVKDREREPHRWGGA